jgi:serine/threonine-protein kinase
MTPSRSAVKAQLESVLKSPLFGSSRRLSDFLRYVVEGTLDNRVGELKEYQIGVEVFERSRDFDPRVDPIVRVEAAKLRAKLLEYYSTDGARDQWVITIPRGAYVPSFQRKDSSSSEKAPDASIAVLPFLNISDDPANEYFSDGLTEELINSLATVPELRIAARTSCFYFKGKNEDIRDIGSKLNVRTVLEGSVRKAENQLRITAQLINVADGYHLWSHTYKREMQDIFAVQEEIANSVRRV